jgi:hypothetical protein
MTSTEQGLEQDVEQRVDAAIGYAALLVRALFYAGIWATVDHYDCGRAMLTGVLVGDIGSRLVSIAWEWRDGLLQVGAELLLLAIVFLFVRSQMVWPDDPAMRAIIGLAAFGVGSVQVGGQLLVRFGPRRSGFA